MLTTVKAGRIYLLIGLSAYLIFILAGMPVSFVWSKISSLIPEQSQRISGVVGTVWQGRANILIEEDRHQLNWRVSPRALWKAQFEVDVAVDNEQLHINTTLFISPFSLGIYNVRGNIDQAYVNRYVRDMGPLSMSQSEKAYHKMKN